MNDKLLALNNSNNETQLAALDELSQTDFPGFLKVMNGQSAEVSEGIASIGDLIMKKSDKVTILGKEIDVIPLGFRMTATSYIDNEYHAFHKPESSEYEQVKTNSKDAELKRSNKHGPEFLLWIPSLGVYATMHLNTYSNWPTAKPVKAGMHRLVTLMSEKKKTPKFTWFIFSADISVNDASDVTLPPDSEEQLNAKIAAFENAADYVPSADKEEAEQDGQAR